ncbi:MAG: hypothetical protein V3W06_04070 [Acidimicrobiia bacterium]
MMVRWVAVALFASLTPISLWAQGAASITATGEVSDLALTTLDVQDLGFGDVTPGLSTVVDPQASLNAGKFEIRGVRGAEVAVDFTLPAALTVGAFSMAVGFGGSDGCFHTKDQQNKCTYFDPSATLVTDLGRKPFPENWLIIWLGGTASPTVTQFPGIYRGTVALTVAYTGN